jgi:hypothetical protein
MGTLIVCVTIETGIRAETPGGTASTVGSGGRSGSRRLRHGT